MFARCLEPTPLRRRSAGKDPAWSLKEAIREFNITDREQQKRLAARLVR
jgi:hypothetical protein